ncbi:MAG: hypothetical protein J5825_04440 [Lachnospiraceae bacterium]|nr:hypothetical protein [Lachnospiraceae bacterium]
MALGLEEFKKHFKEYGDQYILIGGMACDSLFHSIGDTFRPTRDIDMVLIVEALTTEFNHQFWKFIDEGGYEARQRNDGKCEFYRFVNPKNPSFPIMIELFARPGGDVELQYPGHLIPLHIDDEASSLSAILLNEAYYELLLDGRTMVDDLSVLDAEHLIPMKMKAWLDLSKQKAEGIHVNDRDLRKHRQDVFRLFQLLDPEKTISVPGEVYRDIKKFVSIVREHSFDTAAIGIRISKNDILDVFDEIYIEKNSQLKG